MWPLVIGLVKQSPSVGVNSKAPESLSPVNVPEATPPLVDNSP